MEQIIKSERDDFIAKTGVSHETMEKLDVYAKLLTEWNQKFNLVSASTIPHVWNRHFLDSAQLAKHIPASAQTLADMGSGAGFPGLVLAIMGIAPHVHLIESTGKKANFLRTVIEELKLNCTVHQSRTEDIKNQQFDVITARALAPLLDLMYVSKPLMNNNSICLFLKGQNADKELTDSNKYWTFNCEKIASLSDPSASVLIIRNLHIKNAAAHKRR